MISSICFFKGTGTWKSVPVSYRIKDYPVNGFRGTFNKETAVSLDDQFHRAMV